MFILPLVFCFLKKVSVSKFIDKVVKEVLWNETHFKIKVEILQDIKWTEFHLLLKNNNKLKKKNSP